MIEKIPHKMEKDWAVPESFGIFWPKCFKAACAYGSREEMGLLSSHLHGPPIQSLAPILWNLEANSFCFLNYCRAIGNALEDDEEWWQLYMLPTRWWVREPAQTLVEMTLWRWGETYFLASQGPDLGKLQSSFYFFEVCKSFLKPTTDEICF